MPDRSLLRNRSLQRVIAGGFAVENQPNSSTPRLGTHRLRA
jgi:hypothetical protein